jgi:hypothetical protein
MADTKITINASGSQIRHSNPATHPLPPSAGLPIIATVKAIGNPNAAVHGQVSGTTCIFDNPG